MAGCSNGILACCLEQNCCHAVIFFWWCYSRSSSLDCEQSLIFLLRHGRMRAWEMRARMRGDLPPEMRGEPRQRKNNGLQWDLWFAVFHPSLIAVIDSSFLSGNWNHFSCFFLYICCNQQVVLIIYSYHWKSFAFLTQKWKICHFNSWILIY